MRSGHAKGYCSPLAPQASGLEAQVHCPQAIPRASLLVPRWDYHTQETTLFIHIASDSIPLLSTHTTLLLRRAENAQSNNK